jgi:hypothetical protein
MKDTRVLAGCRVGWKARERAQGARRQPLHGTSAPSTLTPVHRAVQPHSSTPRHSTVVKVFSCLGVHLVHGPAAAARHVTSLARREGSESAIGPSTHNSYPLWRNEGSGVAQDATRTRSECRARGAVAPGMPMVADDALGLKEGRARGGGTEARRVKVRGRRHDLLCLVTRQRRRRQPSRLPVRTSSMVRRHARHYGGRRPASVHLQSATTGAGCRLDGARLFYPGPSHDLPGAAGTRS